MHELLTDRGPLNLFWWQWAGVAVVVVVSWVLGVLLGRLSSTLLGKLTSRTPYTWDARLIHRTRAPAALAWAVFIASTGLPLVELSGHAVSVLKEALRLGLFGAMFWALARVTTVVADAAAQSQWAARNRASRSLIMVTARIFKVVLVGLAFVGLLAELGYPVASMLAGLGLGGLAFALAAQKSLENLFGALSIAVDQPLREGDIVRIDNEVGIVEAIGLRSTRIRSLDRTVITVPNGKLAEMKIETLTYRDRIRLSCKLSLVTDTTPQQLREVRDRLAAVLRKHEKIWPDRIDVHVVALGEWSFDIEVNAWFLTTTWIEFLEIRHEVLLQFLQAIESAGSALAFPTQTLHVTPREAAMLASVARTTRVSSSKPS